MITTIIIIMIIAQKRYKLLNEAQEGAQKSERPHNCNAKLIKKTMHLYLACMHNRDSKINCDFAYCPSLLKPKQMTAVNQSHQVLVIMNAQSLFVSKDLCARVVNS